MIKIENIITYNHARAIYSARNAMNSWDKSDSDLENNIVGKNDLVLAQRLYKAGTEHRKFMRQIFVSMDVTAPLYWWKEFDTYKVGTVANSCSTMHKIHAKKFTTNDFSCDHLNQKGLSTLMIMIAALNTYREEFVKTNDKLWWWQMIQLLPSSYNQRRTVTMNYENVVNMIHQREGHKLDCWRDFVKVLKALPHVRAITGVE